MTSALEGGEWSAARPGRTLPPGKTWYPFYRMLGGPQGRSGRAENLVLTWIRSPDCPAHSQSLYWLSYLAHEWSTLHCLIWLEFYVFAFMNCLPMWRNIRNGFSTLSSPLADIFFFICVFEGRFPGITSAHCPCRYLSLFFSVHPGKWRNITSRCDTTASLHVLFNSSSTDSYHLTLYRARYRQRSSI
jgi:hypothetical protein